MEFVREKEDIGTPEIKDAPVSGDHYHNSKVQAKTDWICASSYEIYHKVMASYIINVH